MINLQTNYPVLAEQDVAWNRQLHDAVDRFGAESVRLPEFGGSLHNRQLAANWLNMPVERTWVCTSGHHGTMAALLAAGLAAKTVAVEALTYPWFIRQAQMLGMRVVPVPLDREAIDPDALRATCFREKIDAVYTMPSLHNPTGAVASQVRREAVVAAARELDFTIIEDSAYGFLVPNEPPRYTELAPERAFYIESLSKRAVPGLRTCFLVAPQERADSTWLALRVMTSGSSTLLASLGCAMAADGSLARIIATKRAEGAIRTAKALEILEGFDIVSSSHGWHLWLALPEAGALTAQTAEKSSEDRGVRITGAHWFTAPGAEVPRAVRLALGGETEWDRVAQGLHLFRELLRAS